MDDQQDFDLISGRREDGTGEVTNRNYEEWSRLRVNKALDEDRRHPEQRVAADDVETYFEQRFAREDRSGS